MSEIVINRLPADSDTARGRSHGLNTCPATATATGAGSNPASASASTSTSRSPSPLPQSQSQVQTPTSAASSSTSRGITASMSNTTIDPSATNEIDPADSPFPTLLTTSTAESVTTALASSPSLWRDTPSPTAPAPFSNPITPQLQSPLLRSPSEIIQKVLANAGGDDVPAIARAAKVCRELRSFIYENPDQALWRDIYLQIYDDPRISGTFSSRRTTSEIDWRKRVQERELVGRMFREWDGDRYDEAASHLDLICDTLLDMYLDLPPSTPSFDPSTDDEPPNSTLLTTYLRSALFRHLYQHCSLTEEKPHLRPLRGQTGNPNRRAKRTIVNPKISQLHCLVPPEFDEDVQEDRDWRGYTREVVYNAANFARRNDWGPFTDDGKVDWTLVDAISCVMISNGKDIIRESDDHWRAAVHPMSYGIEPTRGWGYTDLQRPADLPEDEIWDWADVKGTWSGSYAFLDYADWVTLNEPRLVLLRRQGSLDLSTYHEAVGDLMKLDLKIVPEPSEHDSRTLCPRHNVPIDPLPAVTTHLPTSDLLPPIHFAGSSVQHQGPTFPTGTPMSAIRGVVRLTADDPPQVRWTLVIRYGGEDRWRLECVQVGGRGSKRGFFGIWTDALKEDHSPNGPVWYWKD
ncbi:hypothetical protein IAU59_000055 [Kwoniella sp. CBS 9459]